MSSNDEFTRLTDPFRPELLVHCYRMLGSIHDAEDLVQETYLRAWRSYENFEGRSSLRFWLYRIATSACLTALEHRSRRLLPSGLAEPSDDPGGPLYPALPEVEWVQPLPGPLNDPPAADPAVIVASRGSVRLALIAALQHLPAKQRAVLILRDVLAWRAAEVADLLGTTTAAVNSALQRARAQLEQVAPVEDELAEPAEPRHRALLDQYMSAFENADIGALLRLLRDDVALEMPPNMTWFTGRAAVGRFIAAKVFAGPGVTRMVRITANGQPAAAVYWRADDGVHRAHAVQVLTITDTGISRIVSFNDPGLFAAFGLPVSLDAAGVPTSA
ncbi:sigma-70 family RNA polymerase sigma factor [Actinoallomurus purpureus]|uniref:sigma-70 family RNA polymerase sigma factor n=1 Tax=Actinoallomurus purpureus TaxID=478114 RepID=UPI002093AB97|nr:sigma-70 family RNA polymerase sigma factor [Actinoallomurus purpureus]MCO6006393.1 sigma-70 family RNA polymerase sigma factor [Actinoallomurus purpureus]